MVPSFILDFRGGRPPTSFLVRSCRDLLIFPAAYTSYLYVYQKISVLVTRAPPSGASRKRSRRQEKRRRLEGQVRVPHPGRRPDHHLRGHPSDPSQEDKGKSGTGPRGVADVVISSLCTRATCTVPDSTLIRSGPTRWSSRKLPSFGMHVKSRRLPICSPFPLPLRPHAVLFGVTERPFGLGEGRGQVRCSQDHADGERRGSRGVPREGLRV